MSAKGSSKTIKPFTIIGLALFLSLPGLNCSRGTVSSVTNPQTPTTPTTPVTPDVSGDWYIPFPDSPVGVINPIDGFLGSLSVQGSTITGTFRININRSQYPTPCFPTTQDIAFTGTIGSSNLLTLTSSAFSGSTATLQIQLPTDSNVAKGTGQIVGPVCTFSSQPLLAEFTPTISGTYTGSLALNPYQTPNSSSGAATITLIEASANADGQFPVTGTLTYNSTGCNISTPLSGYITGPFFTLNADIPGIIFEGVANSPPTQFTAASSNLYVPTGTTGCTSGFYGGTLTRQ
jgi:hypothetical protein